MSRVFGGQQPLELGAGAAQVAGSGVGLGHADRHVALLRLARAGPRVALLVLEPGQEPVELVALKVELGQPADGAELAVEVVGLVEGPPVHLDRLVGAVLAGQGLGQGERDLGVVGVDPDRPAQGVEPFLGPAELEAELGEELVTVGVARRGGQQVAAGLEGGVDPAQPGFELGDAGQVLGAVAAVDLGQPAQGVGGVAQVAGRLADPGGQGPGRDRPRLDLDRLLGGADGLGELGVGLEVAGQDAPCSAVGFLVAVQLLAQRFDPLWPAGRRPGRS